MSDYFLAVRHMNVSPRPCFVSIHVRSSGAGGGEQLSLTSLHLTFLSVNAGSDISRLVALVLQYCGLNLGVSVT